MKFHAIRVLAEIALVLAVLAASSVVFFNARSRLDSDEVEWIGTTRFFQIYVVEHDVSAQSWPDEYWTRTQPMVARYVIGGWLWLRGYDLKALSPTYDYSQNAAANRRSGLAPPDALLFEARVPMRALAALAVTMLYLVVRVLAGPVGGIVGGLIAATLAAGSPYLQEHLVRAKAESTLMFLLLAALLVGVVGLLRDADLRQRATDGTGRTWTRARWGIATGVLLGLAFGAKLTAVLAILAVAVWGIWACLSNTAALRHPRWEAFRPDAPWGWPAAVLATAGLVFLLSNPFLWPDPAGRTWLLFENRSTEMSDQRANQPNRAINGLDRRAALVWDRSVFNDAFGPSRLGQPVEAVLAAVGAGWLALRGATRRPTATTLVFLWTASLWIGVTAGLGFLLQHYFVPTAMLGTLLAGLASGWAAQAAWQIGARASRRQLPRQHADAPPTPGAVTAP